MILKIMILHCPSTHKHRLVLILASSFRISISLLESTVSNIIGMTAAARQAIQKIQQGRVVLSRYYEDSTYRTKQLGCFF